MEDCVANMLKCKLLTALLVLLLLPACATIQPLPTPYQWNEYCAREGATNRDPSCGNYELKITSSGSADTLQTLRVVNAAVNKFTYAKDTDWQNSYDHWTARLGLRGGAQRGDCDDYALSKRLRLLQLGVANEAMRITLVYNELELHMILLVRVGDKEYVLDNVLQDVVPVQQIKYRPVQQLDPVKNQWVPLQKF